MLDSPTLGEMTLVDAKWQENQRPADDNDGRQLQPLMTVQQYEGACRKNERKRKGDESRQTATSCFPEDVLLFHRLAFHAAG